MRLDRKTTRLLTATLLLSSLAAPASAAPSDDISQWGIVCFCLHSRTNPQRVIKTDDNGRLLYHARNGVTVTQLRKKGVSATPAQLQLLQKWRLLSRAGDEYRTTFPVLPPNRMATLRPKIRTLAHRVAAQIPHEVAELRQILDRQGHPDSHYTILFSYVLDGLVWEELDRHNSLPSSVPTADHPEWNGALWAFAPVRPGVEGTNEIASGSLALASLWNERVLETLRAAAPPADARHLLSGIERNPAMGASRSTALAQLLMDPSGNLTVPIIREEEADPVRAVGLRLARKVVRVLNGPKAKALAAVIPGATEQEALLIITHELMWDVADRLTDMGAVDRPAVLTGSALSAEAMRPLFFVKARLPNQVGVTE